jgi:tight adherence protein B
MLRLHPVTISVLVCLASAGPIGTIYYLRGVRLKKLSNQLPDALGMLSQSLRAGHSLPTGIELVASELPDPIGLEFRRVHIEQQLGVKLEVALDHMAERVDLLDYRMFVSAVHIQRQTGGDLTEIMDRLAAVIRDRIKLLGQVRALTAEGRLSGWILCAIPMVLLMFILRLNPKHALMLFHSSWGQLFLAAGVVMQITGMILIRRIVNIKV